MLAYKENIKLESNKLVIELPQDFAGNFVEVIVLEQNGVFGNHYISNTDFDSQFKSIKVGLTNPNMIISRDDLYE